MKIAVAMGSNKWNWKTRMSHSVLECQTVTVKGTAATWLNNSAECMHWSLYCCNGACVYDFKYLVCILKEI
jgi:hypothetical protein